MAGGYSRAAIHGGAVFGDLQAKRRFRRAVTVSNQSHDQGMASAYGQLLGLLVETPDVDALLNKVVGLAAQAVTPAAACGITVRRDGHPFSAAVSNDLAGQVDELQYGTDEGPCLAALKTGTVFQVDDLSREERWDHYRPRALAHGVVSSLSIPLTVDGETLGALNLYSTVPAAFAGEPRTHAETFAAQCATALTVSLRQVRQAETQRQLAEAMVSSSIIDQAVGILMGQQRCDASTAFDLLRRASQNRNRKLREIAADIITNVSGQPPQPRPGFRPSPGADTTSGA
jgi:GAF domain-containing protein